MQCDPIDIDGLGGVTAPFEVGPATGEDLRLETSPHAIYSALRDARAEARAAERRADEDPASGPANAEGWRTVERLALDALTHRSKDIEIACWLTESLTRSHGLLGLSDGASLLAGLITNFWNTGLHPGFDESDPEARLASLGGLSGQDRDGSLLQPLRKLVLFEREDGAAVSLWHYERASELAGLGEQAKAPRAAADIPSFAEIEISARGRGRAALLATGRAAIRAAASWRGLEAAIASVVPADAVPATGRVANLLDRLRRIVDRYIPAGDLEDAPIAVLTHDVPNSEPAATHDPVPVTANRDTLLDEVLRIAERFRENEPNSPISYTLEEAVRRARLSWPELLREMMPDPTPRAAVLSGLGIRPPPD